MAGGSGAQGPTRRRDRERCDIGDAGAGNGGGRQTRIHAAEVAVVRPGAAVGGLGCELAARESAGGSPARHPAPEKRFDRGVSLLKSPTETRKKQKKVPCGAQKMRWGFVP